MKIKKIFLKDFMNHRETSLDLDTVNFIYGANDAGKSAVVDALRWVLEGPARGMQKANDRMAETDLIRLGQVKVWAGVTLQNGAEPVKFWKERTKTVSKLKKSDGNGGIDIDQADVHQFLNLNESKIAAILSGYRFLELSSSDRKQFIFDLMGSTVNFELTKKYLMEAGIDELRASSWGQSVAFKGFETAEKAAIEERKKIKRMLAEKKTDQPEDFAVTFAGKEYKASVFTSANIAAKITILLKERDELVKQIGKNAPDGFNARTIQREFDEINKTVAECQALAETDTRPISERLDVIEKMGLDSVLKEAETRHAKISGKIEALREQLDRAQKLDVTSGCPTCAQPLTDVMVKKLIIDLKSKIKVEENYLTDAKNELATAQQKQSVFLPEVQRLEQQVKEICAAQAKLNTAKARQVVLQIQMNSLGNVQEENKEINQKIEAIDQRVAELRQIEMKVLSFHENNKKYIESLVPVRALENDVVIYDKLAKALAPDGIIAKIIQKTIEPLENHINEIRNELLPEIRINRETFGFEIRHEGDLWKKESMLNPRGSMFARLSFLVSEAVAWFSQSKIWICDGIDILDDENRKNLQRIVMTVRDSYDTIMLLMTRGKMAEDQVLKMAGAGWKVIEL